MKKIDVRYEDQETTINYSRYQLGDWTEVYTTDKVIMRRFEKFCKDHPDYGKVIREDELSMTFSVHPKCVLYPRAPRKVSMTEEKREMLRENLNRIRNKK